MQEMYLSLSSLSYILITISFFSLQELLYVVSNFGGRSGYSRAVLMRFKSEGRSGRTFLDPPSTVHSSTVV